MIPQKIDLDHDNTSFELGWQRLVVGRDEILCAMGVIEFVKDARLSEDDLRCLLSQLGHAGEVLRAENIQE